MLSTCPDVLSWKEAGSLHAQLRASHQELLTTKFDAALAAFTRAGVGGRLSAFCRTLPADSLARLVTAPESARRLLYGNSTDLVFFTKCALAEHGRLRESVPGESGVWTALGDYYFPAGPPSLVPEEGSWRWDPEQTYQAPRLCDRIVVDYASAHAMRFLRSVKLPSSSIEHTAVPAIVRKLENSLRLAMNISPEAVDLILWHARSFIVYDDPDTANGQHWSFSSERWPGQVGLSNIGHQSADAVGLLDSILHESIHSFVYLAEEVTPILSTDPATLTVMIPSPWTARPLHIHAFLHACLVWFGLWQFWSRATGAERHNASAERVQQMLDRARVGFDNPAMEGAIAATVPYLSPHGQTIVSLVTDVRNGAYG